jgi:hypothetical protein
MRSPKPVTPAEAMAIWSNIKNPSARSVARALSQAGRRVHHSTIARWYAQGWRPVAHRLHPVEAARQAAAQVTVAPVAPAVPSEAGEAWAATQNTTSVAVLYGGSLCLLVSLLGTLGQRIVVGRDFEHHAFCVGIAHLLGLGANLGGVGAPILGIIEQGLGHLHSSYAFLAVFLPTEPTAKATGDHPHIPHP